MPNAESAWGLARSMPEGAPARRQVEGHAVCRQCVQAGGEAIQRTTFSGQRGGEAEERRTGGQRASPDARRYSPAPLPGSSSAHVILRSHLINIRRGVLHVNGARDDATRAASGIGSASSARKLSG
jgi:hypothetical protein